MYLAVSKTDTTSPINKYRTELIFKRQKYPEICVHVREKLTAEFKIEVCGKAKTLIPISFTQ